MSRIAHTYRTLATRSAPRLSLAMVASALLVGAIILVSSKARAAAYACEVGRYNAAAKYASCELKTIQRPVANGQTTLAKCRMKYDHAWPSLHVKAIFDPETETCDQGSASVHVENNGDGTAIDYLTGLQWEQKTDDGSVHDKDNVYTWSDVDLSRATGTAFAFLETLNTSPCFAGQCDWRLPTVYELQTILLPEPFPCATSPCSNQGLFGPTVADDYWSATTNATIVGTTSAWVVSFGDGRLSLKDKHTSNLAVRAVRGSL